MNKQIKTWLLSIGLVAGLALSASSFAAKVIQQTYTNTVASVSANATTTQAVTVTGAAVGDAVLIACVGGRGKVEHQFRLAGHDLFHETRLGNVATDARVARRLDGVVALRLQEHGKKVAVLP